MSWIEGIFHRQGKGILRQRLGAALAPGHHATLPTASVDFSGAFANDDDGTWACQPDGLGGYVWVLVGAGAAGPPGAPGAAGAPGSLVDVLMLGGM